MRVWPSIVIACLLFMSEKAVHAGATTDQLFSAADGREQSRVFGILCDGCVRLYYL